MAEDRLTPQEAVDEAWAGRQGCTSELWTAPCSFGSRTTTGPFGSKTEERLATLLYREVCDLRRFELSL